MLRCNTDTLLVVCMMRFLLSSREEKKKKKKKEKKEKKERKEKKE